MFFNSCLYPFSIALLAILWLLITNHSALCTCKKMQEQASPNAVQHHIVALTSFAAFIPALYIYASFLSAKGAGDSGVIWLVASFIDSYALCKCKQPKRWGWMIALLVTISLWIGGAYGIWKGYLIYA